MFKYKLKRLFKIIFISYIQVQAKEYIKRSRHLKVWDGFGLFCFVCVMDIIYVAFYVSYPHLHAFLAMGNVSDLILLSSKIYV